jgi:hypothetical protein
VTHIVRLVPSQRWSSSWTAPAGLAPQRPAGEPGPGVLALVHLAVVLGLSAVGSIAPAVAGRSETAEIVTLFVVGAVAAVAGLVVRRSPAPLAGWVADLLLAASAGYLFGGAGSWAHNAGASDDAAFLTGALTALPWALAAYALQRRVWTLLAVVLASAAAIQAAVGVRPEVPDAVAGTYLLVLGGFLALLAISGVVRPPRAAFVMSALLGTAGANGLLDSNTALGSVVAVAVVVLVAVGVFVSGNRSLLPIVLIAGLLLLPQVLQPAIGLGDAISLSLVGVAAAVAWLAADLVRRSPRPPQVGGVFATCLTAVIVSGVFSAFGDEQKLFDLAYALAVTAFFGAVATARRRPATVVSGLFVVSVLPRALVLGHGGAAEGLMSLVLLGGVIALTVRLGTWKGRPAAAADQQELALAGEGRAWTVASPYQAVFDAVVAVLGSAGVPLQLVDRAAGRVVAGDPVRPLLVVAVWATDPVRAHVRAVGAPHDVDRLEADVEQRLAQRAPNDVVSPH